MLANASFIITSTSTETSLEDVLPRTRHLQPQGREPIVALLLSTTAAPSATASSLE